MIEVRLCLQIVGLVGSRTLILGACQILGSQDITCRDKLIFQISRVDYDDRSQTVFADVGRLLYPILVTLPQSVGFSQKKWKLLEEEILVTLPQEKLVTLPQSVGWLLSKEMETV